MPAPDDVYKNEVDFTTLALQYPQFAKRSVSPIPRTRENDPCKYAGIVPVASTLSSYHQHSPAKSTPFYKPRLKQNRQLDFSDPESVRYAAKNLPFNVGSLVGHLFLT